MRLHCTFTDIIHRAVATARASNNSLPPGNPAAPTATAASIATDSTLPQMHSLDRLRSANLALAQQAFQNQRVVEPTAPLLQLNTSSSAQFSALLASLGGMNQPRNTAVNPTGWSAGSPVALLTAAYPTIPPALSAQAPATAGLNPNSSAPSSNQAAVRDITESARTQALTEDDRPVQGPCCVLLYTPADDTMTSPYQCKCSLLLKSKFASVYTISAFLAYYQVWRDNNWNFSPRNRRTWKLDPKGGTVPYSKHRWEFAVSGALAIPIDCAIGPLRIILPKSLVFTKLLKTLSTLICVRVVIKFH